VASAGNVGNVHQSKQGQIAWVIKAAFAKVGVECQS
jgi:hypothetical protein